MTADCRYDYEAARLLLDEQAWEQAGINDAEELRLCWDAGFDASTIAAWLSADLNVLSGGPEDTNVPLPDLIAAAQAWKVAGFSPEEATAWCRVLNSHGDWSDLFYEARRWRAAGFDPDSAQHWRRSGVLEGEQDLEFAVLFANQEWHPLHAAILGILLLDRYPNGDRDEQRRAWLALELGPVDTLNYVKAGVTCEQATAFESLDLQPATLAAELQARYDRLPPLDTFLAMNINHINFGHGNDAPDEDLPLYVRHIRDVHDERLEREERAAADEWRVHANSAGQRLIAVIEVGDNVSEDADAQAAFTLRRAAIAAAENAGYDRTEVTISPEQLGYHCIATTPDGRGYAAVIDIVHGKALGGRREPTDAEVQTWARNAPP